MKTILNWMGNHPILTIVLLVVVFSGLADLIKAFAGAR
jgi:hypothetical protein